MFDSKSVDLSTLTETLQSLADIVSRQSRRRGALPMIPAVQPVTEDGVIERLAEIQRVVSLMADNLRNDARENLPTTINLTSNGLQEALQQIERELSRIRPEQFRGSGTVSVQHTPNGINIHGRSGDTASTPQLSRRYDEMPMGTLQMWDGPDSDAEVLAAWGPKWCLADGRAIDNPLSIYHGKTVPDFRDRSPVGPGAMSSGIGDEIGEEFLELDDHPHAHDIDQGNVGAEDAGSSPIFVAAPGSNTTAETILYHSGSPEGPNLPPGDPGRSSTKFWLYHPCLVVCMVVKYLP